ncbi:MAG: dihydrolipoyllysine-residue acetyltransferase [Gammaproteobacteria bacterium]|nr:dihydrolipoyllysine-residue acetyltransferase [Gammaproteobacteria bacterium]
MAREINVPNIGDFDSVEVIEVLVNAGDTIAIDDALITLESDKASMDIPAAEGGVIKEVKVKVGDQISEGSLILLLEASSEESVQVAPKDAQPKVSESAAATPAPSDSGGGYGGVTLEDICVPDIGDFGSVDVIEVLIQVGDKINEEDALITLESDKASMDIPAPKGGVVKEVKIKVGDQVSEGSLIMTLETQGGAGSAPVSADIGTQPAGGLAKTPERVPAAASAVDAVAFRRAHASPSIRRIARELQVDLVSISGSGRNGRITESDVRGFKHGAPSAEKPAAAGGEMGIPLISQPDWSKFGEIEMVPMSRINKLSAKHLHRAWLNVPQVTHFDEADITDLESYRQAKKDIAKAQGFSLTPLVFMMKAVSAGLKQYPKFNSAMDDAGENLIQRKFYNIGIAVDTPDGLVVPVFRDVDQKSLFELGSELGEMSKRARDGKLKAADMQGGCFTISSLGGIGGTNFTPIVNAPEVGILGLTRSQTRLVRANGEIVDRLIQPLAVSYDHRVIDGAYAARFVSHLSELLSDLRNLLL